MKLKFQDNIDKIVGCPAANELGDKKLFRCVEDPADENSFIPQAILLKPKHEDLCIGWGISLFSSLEAANNALNSLSLRKRGKYTRIAEAVINDDHGIKHCGKNTLHYTFFPYEDFDIVSNFTLV